MESLTSLDLWRNRISALPEDVGCLSRLQVSELFDALPVHPSSILSRHVFSLLCGISDLEPSEQLFA